MFREIMFYWFDVCWQWFRIISHNIIVQMVIEFESVVELNHKHKWKLRPDTLLLVSHFCQFTCPPPSILFCTDSLTGHFASNTRKSSLASLHELFSKFQRQTVTLIHACPCTLRLKKLVVDSYFKSCRCRGTQYVYNYDKTAGVTIRKTKRK